MKVNYRGLTKRQIRKIKRKEDKQRKKNNQKIQIVGKQKKYKNPQQIFQGVQSGAISFSAGLTKLSKHLESNIPKSEIWFRDLYSKHYQAESDRFNVPLHSRYIPDVTNIVFKYIIEIDGSVHNTPEQQAADKVKDDYYKDKGFTVIRIKAYCEDSYIQAIVKLFDLRHKRRYPTVAFNTFLKKKDLDIGKLGMLR